MKKTVFILSTTALLATIALVSCKDTVSKSSSPQDSVAPELRVKRGEYIVNSVGCDDCHSPKKMGAHGPELIPELRLSGYPADRPVQSADTNVVKQGWVMFGPDLTSAVGPWGMSFAANITPDDTGIGNWTEENFLTAIRHGKSKGLEGARDLLPPMPWFVYKNMTDEDLKSIFAYLKTVKPVKNIVPNPKPFTAVK